MWGCKHRTVSTFATWKQVAGCFLILCKPLHLSTKRFIMRDIVMEVRGDNIGYDKRQLCEKMNISQAELCRRIGQTPQNFNKS